MEAQESLDFQPRTQTQDMKYFLLAVISLSLISCEPRAEVKKDNIVTLYLPGVGKVTRYCIIAEYGYHYIYVADGRQSITAIQKQGKATIPITIIMNDGQEYELVPKVEK